MPFFFYDYTYLIFVVPALLISMIAQMRVQSNFKKYSRVRTSRNITGREAALEVLRRAGLTHIPVMQVGGQLTDHYDPRNNVISLSQGVYDSASVAAVGVAAHETGHALQHASGYIPIKIRNAILPIAQIGSSISIPLVILGIILSWGPLIDIGIILFCGVLLFQLITLPVEFNASRRAMNILTESGMIITEDERRGVKKVLSAAAMTYVASVLTSLGQLLRLLVMSNNRRR